MGKLSLKDKVCIFIYWGEYYVLFLIERIKQKHAIVIIKCKNDFFLFYIILYAEFLWVLVTWLDKTSDLKMSTGSEKL